MATIKQLLDEALSLDESGRAVEAYSRYMDTIAAIARKLDDNKRVEPGALSAMTVVHAGRLFALLRNCVDRAEAIVAATAPQTAPQTAPDGPARRESDSSVSSRQNSQTDSPSSSSLSLTLSPTTSSTSVLSVSSAVPSSSSSVLSARASPAIFDEERELERAREPVRQAQAKNKQLLRQYQARMATLTGAARSNMQMTMMRVLHENIQLAKEKQKKLLDELNERKAQHLATEEKLRLEAAHLMRQQQQLQSAAAVAAEDEFQRLLRERPDDVDTLYKIVASMLRSPGHVAAQFFSGLVDAFTRTFGDPAALKALEGQSHEHIEEATKKMEMEAHSIPLRIVDYFVARYDSLSRSDVFVAQVEIAAEDAVFADLHAVILAYYRIVHAASDAALSAKMADAASISPRDLGIRSKFCLLPQAEEELEPSQTPPPYDRAIRTLSLITSDTTPSAKATRIARVSQQIVECVNEYWSLRGMDTSSEAMAVGCDDLLPIMSYVLIKAAPPHVRSQLAYLSEFMNQASGMGLEGYAFATLETALDHVEGIVLLSR